MHGQFTQCKNYSCLPSAGSALQHSQQGHVL